MPILEAQNISKSFHGISALNDFSINIPEKSIYGLLGPNGSGKTTFLRILNRILLEDSGSILFNGNVISEKDVVKIGYLPEERGLYKNLTAREHIIYIARLKGLKKTEINTKIEYWASRLLINQWINKKIEELSKGMQQKVQFIIAVIAEPKLLILDEPFSGFDPINIEFIKNEIRELRNQGTAVLLSTHRMDAANELCDHICLIKKGVKILDGNLNELINQYDKNTYEIGFFGSIISFTNALWTSAKVIEQKTEDSKNYVTIQLLQKFKPNDVLTQVTPHIQVFQMKQILPNVNDIFIQNINLNE